MQTYVFQIELEPDAEGWRAFYPPWEEIGASTWGVSKEEALKNIQEVLTLILDELAEEGRSPTGDRSLQVTEGALVTVSR